MRLSTLLLAAATLTASTAAFAEQPGRPTHKQLVAAGCTSQYVHTPAGKMVHSAPIVRCPTERVLAANTAPTKVARD